MGLVAYCNPFSFFALLDDIFKLIFSLLFFSSTSQMQANNNIEVPFLNTVINLNSQQSNTAEPKYTPKAEVDVKVKTDNHVKSEVHFSFTLSQIFDLCMHILFPYHYLFLKIITCIKNQPYSWVDIDSCVILE